MVVLIIEGPDLAGKSYAIEKIGKLFNSGFILKNTYKPKTSGDEEIYSRYWRILNIMDFGWPIRSDVIVLDRFFPSQAVYSILRGKDEMYSSDIINLDTYCAQRNYLYVYLNTPEDVLNKRFDERGDEHIKKDDLVNLKRRYDKFYELTQMSKMMLDTTKEDWLNTIKNEVENYEYK